MSEAEDTSLVGCWSGGKDSCLACYLASQAGHQVRQLFHIARGRRFQHGLDARLIRMQADAIGAEICSAMAQARQSDFELYFNAMREFKAQGFTGMVFGDLGGTASRLSWFEDASSAAGMPVHLPLFGVDHRDLLQMLVSAGFDAIIVNANASLFGREWLGHSVDAEFISFMDSIIVSRPGLSHAGELGEYHTLVLDGPNFRQRLEIQAQEAVLYENHWFLEIESCELASKSPAGLQLAPSRQAMSRSCEFSLASDGRECRLAGRDKAPPDERL